MLAAGEGLLDSTLGLVLQRDVWVAGMTSSSAVSAFSNPTSPAGTLAEGVGSFFSYGSCGTS